MQKSCFYDTAGIGFIWRKAVQLFHRSDYHYFKKTGIQLFGGSAWWILPDKVIEYILCEYDNNGEYIQRLLATYTPEETFFQILTMRTDYSNLVKLNNPSSVEQSCKTFAYFSDIGKPFCGHPYILTTENAKLLSNLDDYWIARKFDMESDEAIFDYIDFNLLNNEGQ